MGQQHGYDPDAEPTHALPPDLVAKLIEADQWHDKRQSMIDANYPDAGDWSDSVAEGNQLLAEVVEIVRRAWGFGP